MAYESKRWRDDPCAKLVMCSTCIHRKKEGVSCKAFPSGIPRELMLRGEHDTPYPGDNGIRYEPKEKTD